MLRKIDFIYQKKFPMDSLVYHLYASCHINSTLKIEVTLISNLPVRHSLPFTIFFSCNTITCLSNLKVHNLFDIAGHIMFIYMNCDRQ